jgi:site-specific recombinase
MQASPLRQVLESIAVYPGKDTDRLSRLVQAIRPSKAQRKAGEVPGFDALLSLLEHHPELRQGLSEYLERLLEGRRLSTALLDLGMPLGDFWHELRERLIYKVLPYQPEKDTIEYILVNVFFRERDGQWVAALDDAKCMRFLDLVGGVGMDQIPVHAHLLKELIFTAKALALRIAGRAFDSGVLRMVPEYATFESPFVALEAEVDQYLTGLREGTTTRDAEDPTYRHVLVLLKQGRELVERAYRNSGKYGIGFRTNQHLMMLDQMLSRMGMVLRAIAVDTEQDGRLATVRLVKDLVVFSSGSTRVKGFLDQSTQVISREITQHTGRSGEHYITTNRAEYFKMLRTALGGGFVVAFACVIKAWASTWDMSLFGQAFVYSLNYAGAFITIYLLHWTLATKQPAMTAATLAAALDKAKGRSDRARYEPLVDLMARVWRSQFIAFVGNVFMAFPVALALGYGWNFLFGDALLTQKAPKLIKELDPFTSLAMLHAGFAGVFLFISGLIAGSANNRSLYRRIPLRIEEHPVLKLAMPLYLRRRIAGYYERNFGGIISNFWFGIFMGSLGTLGLFLGLPLDIRHITFAAGNFALGLVGNNWQVSTYMVAASIIGIGVIGFINFIVSFTLSLGLAMRSRGISLGQLLPIGKAVWAKYLEEPASFYFPPKDGAATDASEGVEDDAKQKAPEPQVANREGASK